MTPPNPPIALRTKTAAAMFADSRAAFLAEIVIHGPSAYLGAAAEPFPHVTSGAKAAPLVISVCATAACAGIIILSPPAIFSISVQRGVICPGKWLKVFRRIVLSIFIIVMNVYRGVIYTSNKAMLESPVLIRNLFANIPPIYERRSNRLGLWVPFPRDSFGGYFAGYFSAVTSNIISSSSRFLSLPNISASLAVKSRWNDFTASACTNMSYSFPAHEISFCGWQ